MKNLNLIIVYHYSQNKVLMCLRSKPPYQGLFNFVGGKVEEGENKLDSAYRELQEETGITSQDIVLSHLMNFQYIDSQIELEVFVGKLNKDIVLKEELNHLFWVEEDENFFDMSKYAGEGNIGHMIWQVKLRKEKLFL